MNILTAEHLQKAYTTERILLNDAAFSLQQGEKVGVIGINGMGKSTLLKLLAGAEEPDAGTVIMGRHVKLAYLKQTPILEDTDSVLEAAMKGLDVKDMVLESQAKSMLFELGFSELHETVKFLSGGQKKRIALTNTLLQPVDLLILDEPTNHLDITSKEILEEALNQYTGTVLFVSHDRYFINKTATRILDLTEQTLIGYPGNYDYYLEKRDARMQSVKAAGAQEKKEEKNGEAKLDWKQKKAAQAKERKKAADLKRTEEAIAEKEAYLSDLNEALNDPAHATNAGKLSEIHCAMQKTQEELEALYETWELLAD